MTQRSRKLVGTVVTLLLLVVYAVAAMELYVIWFAGSPWWAALLLLAGLGLLWFYPASWIIRWMAKPD